MRSWREERAHAFPQSNQREGSDRSPDDHSPPPPMASTAPPTPVRRLERRNARRYEPELPETASSSSSSSSFFSEEPLSLDERRRTQSLDVLPSYTNRTSFRIHGSSPLEVENICRNLGLNGPEDFAIPAAAWEARKSRSSSDRLPDSTLFRIDDDDDGGGGGGPGPAETPPESPREARGAEGGIRGPRPPPLEHPKPVRADVDDGAGAEVEGAKEVGDEGLSEMSVSEETLEVAMGVKDEGPSEMSFVEVEDEGPSEMSFAEVTPEVATEVEDCAVSPVDRTVSVKRQISDWSLGKELGKGSFGTVYEAINFDGFFFAVKEVSLFGEDDSAQQLEHEIALLSHFEHPNIVQYLGTEKVEGKLYIFLELVTQGSLASLYRNYQLRDTQVSSYTRQILHGLKYLHERNVVHRDIKCANILVDANGYVKLADFGLAKQASALTMLNSCKGSVYWMAPEVIRPRTPYGSAADIWSLGCTVLEMLTGNIPYPNLEFQHALFKIGRGEKPVIPKSLSSEARDFISKCVQVNPKDRPDAESLLNHPFVTQYSASSVNGLEGSSRGRRL